MNLRLFAATSGLLLFGAFPAPAESGEETKPEQPCEADENCRRLDFWIGEWDVFNGAGDKVGSNHIEKSMDGCLITENWTSANSAGTSMNYVDPATGKWRQHWIDPSGGTIQYEGEWNGNGLSFEGRNYQKDGSFAPSRMILEPTPEGWVHQRIEQSGDGGVTWAIWFEGIYKPAG